LGVLLSAGGGVVRAAQPVHNRLTPEEVKAGWRLLFDGITSVGWQEVTGKAFPADCWAIEGGALKAYSNAAAGNHDIRTTAQYTYFELAWEWRIAPGGNSGVKYLVQRNDTWNNARGNQARARGLEYQMVDEGTPDGDDPRKRTASLYGLLAPTEPPNVHPPGSWNRSRIVVGPNRLVEHWLNEVKVLEFSFDQPEVFRFLTTARRDGQPVLAAPICLQNHNSEAWFRDLKIRALR
jgi:hypothetical protein